LAHKGRGEVEKQRTAKKKKKSSKKLLSAEPGEEEGINLGEEVKE